MPVYVLCHMATAFIFGLREIRNWRNKQIYQADSAHPNPKPQMEAEKSSNKLVSCCSTEHAECNNTTFTYKSFVVKLLKYGKVQKYSLFRSRITTYFEHWAWHQNDEMNSESWIFFNGNYSIWTAEKDKWDKWINERSFQCYHGV